MVADREKQNKKTKKKTNSNRIEVTSKRLVDLDFFKSQIKNLTLIQFANNHWDKFNFN